MSKGQLQSWLDEDWVRIGADGSIKGKCGDRKKSEGKPKCLPRNKANSLSKEERARLVARKRKKDPNPRRKGKPINVSNKLNAGGEVTMKKAKRDYDGDGKIESSKDEYFGSRDKAIKSAMSKQNRVKMKMADLLPMDCGAIMKDRKKVTKIS